VKFFFILFSFVFFFHFAQTNEGAPCSSSSIQEITVPLSYDDTASTATFSLKYQFVKGTSSNTIILIGGGPSPKIGSQFAKRFEQLETFNVISFDYRGLGCNSLPESVVTKYGKKIINREYFARDLAMLIDNLKLESKSYIIFAHSYGTTVTPELSTLIHNEKLPAPLAIFMTGTVEHTDTIKYLNCDGNCRFIKELKKLLKLLPNKYKDYYSNLFTDDYNKLPNILGVSGKFWRKSIWGTLSSYGSEKTISFLKNLYYAATNPESKYSRRLKKWGQLKTQVAVPQNGNDTFYSNSKITNYVLRSELDWGSLSQYPNHTYRFDSSVIKLKHPVIYIHGNGDFLTPIEMTENSFLSQTDVKNKIIVNLKAGHSFTTGQLRCLNDVLDKIFNEVEISKENYTSSFKTCPTIDIKD